VGDGGLDPGSELGIDVAAVLAVPGVLIARPAAVGAVILAFEFGFVAEELNEIGRVAVEDFVSADFQEQGVGAGLGGLKFLDFGGEEGLLVEAGAAEAPLGVGHFADRSRLGEVGGLEVVVKFGEEGVVFGGVFAGEEHGEGAEAVAKAVKGGAGFTGDGSRAGRVLGIFAIGSDLCKGGHKKDILSGETKKQARWPAHGRFHCSTAGAMVYR
jgi:hypothetical protein